MEEVFQVSGDASGLLGDEGAACGASKGSALSSVNDAVVVDVPAAAIPHPNGPGWWRLVLSNKDALELFRDLRKFYGE